MLFFLCRLIFGFVLFWRYFLPVRSAIQQFDWCWLMGFLQRHACFFCAIFFINMIERLFFRSSLSRMKFNSSIRVAGSSTNILIFEMQLQIKSFLTRFTFLLIELNSSFGIISAMCMWTKKCLFSCPALFEWSHWSERERKKQIKLIQFFPRFNLPFFGFFFFQELSVVNCIKWRIRNVMTTNGLQFNKMALQQKNQQQQQNMEIALKPIWIIYMDIKWKRGSEIETKTAQKIYIYIYT